MIELLVVVAIIALLISILLPSLSKARAQARATLCGTRIGQLTKAMILYASDFDEAPPFVGIGFRHLGEEHAYPHLGSDVTEYSMAVHENWLIDPLFPGNNPGNLAFVNPQVAWENMDPPLRVDSGKLFPYTRFANLYRCPEFERIPNGTPGRQGRPKMQNTFNYTRTILGRKMLTSLPIPGISGLPDPGAPDPLSPGPVMKLSAIYAPGGMFMMLDEQWDYHCAGNFRTAAKEPDGSTIDMEYAWMGADPIHGLVFDCIGSYHGTEGKVIPEDIIYKNKKGNISYYDGHVEAYQDPWPYRAGGTQAQLIAMLLQHIQEDGPGLKVLDPITLSLYAQRAIGLTKDQIIFLITSLIG